MSRSRPSCSTWSAPRWAEWLRLSPANGRRQPLIVYAKITVGRVRSASASTEGALELELIVPAEVADEPRQIVVGNVADVPREGIASPGRRAFDEALTQLRTRPPDQDLVVLVLHVVDALAKGLAARPREPFLEQLPVLRFDGVPAGCGEHALDATDADPRHDPIEALAVEVDDHRHVAELAQALLEDRLPDVALRQVPRRRRAPRTGAPAGSRSTPGSGAAGSDRREPRTSAPPRQARPSRSRSRRGRDPSSATGTTGAHRTRAAG